MSKEGDDKRAPSPHMKSSCGMASPKECEKDSSGRVETTQVLWGAESRSGQSKPARCSSAILNEITPRPVVGNAKSNALRIRDAGGVNNIRRKVIWVVERIGPAKIAVTVEPCLIGRPTSSCVIATNHRSGNRRGVYGKIYIIASIEHHLT